MYTPSRHIMDFYIAGFTYWDGLKALPALCPGSVLTLKGEPDNPYDPDAVALYYKKYKLGYIPRTDNSLISKFVFFGLGNVFKAKVSQVDLTVHPARQIRVTVRIKDRRGRKHPLPMRPRHKA